MSWRARRKAKKADKAYRKLHGIGAVSVPPRQRGGSGDWDDVIVDAFVLVGQGIVKIFEMIFD